MTRTSKPIALTFTLLVCAAACSTRALRAQTRAAGPRLQALETIESAESDLSVLQQHHNGAVAAASEMADLYIRLGQALDETAELASRVQAARRDGRTRDAARLAEQLAVEALRVSELNRSFSMQLLGLQQKLQQESRKFTLLSNVMKTKHETAKNAINNIR